MGVTDVLHMHHNCSCLQVSTVQNIGLHKTVVETNGTANGQLTLSQTASKQLF